MKKTTKLIALVLISALFVTLFSACNELSSVMESLTGTKLEGCIWKAESEDISYDMPMEFELFSDGTGSVTYDSSLGEGTLEVTWVAENGRLKLSSLLVSMTYDYSISGSKLTLTYDGDDGAETVIYYAN